MRETIIGMDTHISKSNYYAMEREGGGLLGVGEFKTSAQNFIMSVNKFPQPRTVIIEQGPMAEWIKRVLEPKFAKVILADPKQNSWIAKDRNKNDEVDAKKLACLYVGGFVKEIQTRSVAKAELITYVIHYHGLIKQIVRIKNQLSAKFRQQGIRKKGAGAYEAEKISQDLCLMDSGPAMQEAILQMRSQLELLERQRDQVKSKLQKLSEGFSEVKCLEDFSGIGFVGAITLSALIDIPERFSTVKKIWIYCGYGLDRQSSGNNPGCPRITRRSNRMIKDVIMTAVHIIIQVDKNSAYKLWYLEQIRLGKSPQKMRANLARKLIKDIWLTWRKHNELIKIKAA